MVRCGFRSLRPTRCPSTAPAGSISHRRPRGQKPRAGFFAPDTAGRFPMVFRSAHGIGQCEARAPLRGTPRPSVRALDTSGFSSASPDHGRHFCISKIAAILRGSRVGKRSVNPIGCRSRRLAERIRDTASATVMPRISFFARVWTRPLRRLVIAERCRSTGPGVLAASPPR